MGAVMLYSVLVDQLEWVDGDQRRCAQISAEQLAGLMGCSIKSVGRYKAELIAAGLLTQQTIGSGEPNLLYPKYIVEEEIS